jgi:hypothetical protein
MGAKKSEAFKSKRLILGFIAARGEVFFKELEESMMAKSFVPRELEGAISD